MQEKSIEGASIEDLADRIASKVEERIKAQKHHTPKNQYLTRRQLSELLDTDLATIYRWSKSGKLPSYRLGGKIFYKLDDIEAQMKRVPNLKDGRA